MGRLQKGTLAPGIAARSNRAKESIAARLRALDDLRRAGSKRGDARLAFFETIDALAAWTDTDCGITPVSPKTMRKHIEHLYQGGYEAFMAAVDELRSTSTKMALHSSVEGEVRRRVQREAAAVMEMTNRYLDLMKRMRVLADTNPTAMTQFKHHLQMFGDDPPHLKVVK